MQSTRWARAIYSEIHILEFGEESVVYDSGSGDTHAVDPIAAHVLSRIAEQPQGRLDLKDSILQEFDFLADSDIETYLDALLRTLSLKHLIRPIDA